jgi:hypothetical protein
MAINLSLYERDNVEITPLIFKCKFDRDCQGKASYTFIIDYVVPKRVGGTRKLIPPPILGRLTTCTPDCNGTIKHPNTYEVAFFKCATPNCDGYVMGTNEDSCLNKDRIFDDKHEAKLTCHNGHINTYKLMY